MFKVTIFVFFFVGSDRTHPPLGGAHPSRGVCLTAQWAESNIPTAMKLLQTGLTFHIYVLVAHSLVISCL